MRRQIKSVNHHDKSTHTHARIHPSVLLPSDRERRRHCCPAAFCVSTALPISSSYRPGGGRSLRPTSPGSGWPPRGARWTRPAARTRWCPTASRPPRSSRCSSSSRPPC
ncbi:hypothetical protein ACQJBY_051606 [Aegilops geniculata]